jgi:glycosyltransferase involved in cell wall biosynthesis
VLRGEPDPGPGAATGAAAGRVPEISFVIPAYNEEDNIVTCLEAVMRALAAADCTAEVIVVNNASTDRTVERAAAFAGVRVVDEPVKGLGPARQAGFLAARGDLVANLDADTRPTERWLAVVLDTFRRDPGLAALSGPFIYYDLPAIWRVSTWAFYALAYLAHLFNQHVLRVGAMLQGGNFVVRRTALEAIGGFDTSIDFYGEDTDIARRLSKVGRVKWTFRLPIKSSGRRLIEEGVVRTGLRYALNFIWVTFVGRPWTTTHRDIRSQ